MTTLQQRTLTPQPTAPPTATRIGGLDGLRGLAASFVVLHHIYLLAFPGYPRATGPAWCSWLIYGHFAVAVFIVLSGFSLAVAPARNGWRIADTRRFFRRRAWRILPTYWPALVFSLVVAWTITAQPGEATPGLKSVLVNGLLVQDVFGAATPNGAFWSIPIEVQLYFAFPLLILVARHLGASVMTAIATGLVVAEGLAAPHVHLAHQVLRLTPQFAALFAMGVAAAGLLRSAGRRGVVPVAALLSLVPPVALIAVRGSTWTLNHLFAVDLALGPGIALSVAAVASGSARRARRVLDSPPLRSLGSFSYTLYLVHAPIVVAVYHLFVADRFGHGTKAFIVALALAAPAALIGARLFAALFEFPFTRTGSWPAFRERYLARDTVLNLTFHGIGDPVRPFEPNEAPAWISVEQFEQVLDAVAGRSDVRLTFDDGNASDFEIALPRLLERGLSARFFVCAGLLGQPGRLGEDDVRRLVGAGMAIGSHGWTHVDWRRMDASAAVREIHQARRELRHVGGRHVDEVAVPFGSYDRGVLRQLRRAGIARVYTSDGGRARESSWLQSRTSVTAALSPAGLERLLEPRAGLRVRATKWAYRLAKRLRGTPGAPPWRRPSPRPTPTSPAVPAGRTPRIAAVIVTYNSADLLTDCLRSLEAGAAGVELDRVLVVDNDSNDGWREVVDQFADWPVSAVPLHRNGGYAAGINAGLDRLDLASLDAVLLLNPDCRLAAGAIAKLAAALTVPGRGISVPKLVNPDGTLQPTLRRAPAVHRTLAESLLGRSAGRLRVGELVTAPADHEQPGLWSWATGAAMLVATATLRDIGWWDESFFLFSEETEFALRAADSGWQLWYEPAALILHIGGESHRAPAFAALMARNRVQLHARRHGAVPAIAYLGAVLVGEAVRGVVRAPSRAAVRALLTRPRPVRPLPDQSR